MEQTKTSQLQVPDGEAMSSDMARDDSRFKLQEVTILFADLRGFTAISSDYPADVVIGILNRFLSAMSEIVIRHNGTIDKFIGDSIMALFGAPEFHDNDLSQALTCAVEMQLKMDEINASNQRINLPPIYMGIGINTGKVMAGRLGSPLHSEYTVIGDSVNLASRIESFSMRGQILVGESTYQQSTDFIKTGEAIKIFVKGKSTPVEVHEILKIPSMGLSVPRRDARRSQRVKVNMPFTLQIVEHKIVGSEIWQGTILDISYYGIQARLSHTINAFDDIKLSMDLSLIGYHAGDIYGKVLRASEKDGVYLAAIEFTSITVQHEFNIRQFVQMLLQGCEKAQ